MGQSNLPSATMQSFLLITVALLAAGHVASAQDIYEGCGVDKECLGYDYDLAENECLETKNCHLVISYTSSEDTAFFEMLHSDEEAAEGYVAIGFSHDQAMGDEAVVMATAAGFTSRWNNPLPVHDSIETEDIGVVGGLVQVEDGKLYAAFELPLSFVVVNPNDGSEEAEDLRAEEHYILCSCGGLDPAGEPIKHELARYSENLISL